MPISCCIPGTGLLITTDLAGTSVQKSLGVLGNGQRSTTDPADTSVELITLALGALAGVAVV